MQFSNTVQEPAFSPTRYCGRCALSRSLQQSKSIHDLRPFSEPSTPGVRLFEDSVENVRAICESMEIAAVDCIISGLPWAFFPKSMQIIFLDQMMKVLKPGGRFVTFGYLHSLALPTGRHLAALLPTYFTTVSRSIVWFNLPPALIHRCRR